MNRHLRIIPIVWKHRSFKKWIIVKIFDERGLRCFFRLTCYSLAKDFSFDVRWPFGSLGKVLLSWQNNHQRAKVIKVFHEWMLWEKWNTKMILQSLSRKNSSKFMTWLRRINFESFRNFLNSLLERNNF